MADDQPPGSDPDSASPASIPNEPVAAAPAADPAAAADPSATDAAAAPSDGSDIIDQAAIDELLKQANFEDVSPEAVAQASTGGAAEAASFDAAPFELPSFNQVMQDAQASSIDLLRDVELNVKIELGRSRMLVEDVLKLAEGSVVELDKLAGDPVDVFVNDRLVARGEVLVLNDNFCVRVNEIVAGLKEEGM